MKEGIRFRDGCQIHGQREGSEVADQERGAGGVQRRLCRRRGREREGQLCRPTRARCRRGCGNRIVQAKGGRCDLAESREDRVGGMLGLFAPETGEGKVNVHVVSVELVQAGHLLGDGAEGSDRGFRIDFPEDAVQAEFGADLGMTSGFNMNSEFGGDYTFGMMVLIHRSDVADAYITYLSTDFNLILEVMEIAFHALRFKD